MLLRRSPPPVLPAFGAGCKVCWEVEDSRTSIRVDMILKGCFSSLLVALRLLMLVLLSDYRFYFHSAHDTKDKEISHLSNKDPDPPSRLQTKNNKPPTSRDEPKADKHKKANRAMPASSARTKEASKSGGSVSSLRKIIRRTLIG